MIDNIVQILRRAKELIDAGYARGAFAKRHVEGMVTRYDQYDQPCELDDPRACCFCSLGAIAKATGVNPTEKFGTVWVDENKPPRQAVVMLSRAAKELFPETAAKYRSDSPGLIVHVNDELGRTAALQMYAKAIELAEAA